MTISGKETLLEPGDAITCEPGELHSARNLGEVAFRFVAFKTNWSEDDSFWDVPQGQ